MANIDIIDPFTGDPATSVNYSTNRVDGFVLTGSAHPSVTVIRVSDGQGGLFASDDGSGVVTLSAGEWTFEPILESGENKFTIVGYTGSGAATDAIEAIIVNADEDTLGIDASPPTGIRVRRTRDRVEILCVESPEPEVVGYNFYAAALPAGGTEGYLRINPDLVTTPSESREEVLDKDTIITETANQDGTVTRTTTVEERIRTRNIFSFMHDRRADQNDPVAPGLNSGAFEDIPNTEPLYYVITAIARDPSTHEEVESVFSSEVPGLPLIVDTSIREIPLRRQDEVARDFIDQVLRTQGAISVNPGTYTRDVAIDPAANEFQQAYFLLDWSRRRQSFLTLMEIDDPNGDGFSDPVDAVPYKQALQLASGFSTEDEVQSTINSAFTELAGNYGVMRKGAETAAGRIVFFTNVRPARSVSVPIGAIVSTAGPNPAQFITTAPISVALEDMDSFYNVDNARWEFRTGIRASQAGDGGNVAAGTIVRPVSGVPAELRVVNDEATVFGQDVESNSSLAERAMLAFSSVDSGTRNGYLAAALGTPGVLRARVIAAGDELMQRDYDELRQRHIGGKVDIYVQGDDEQPATDRFAFTFAELTLVFDLVSDPSTSLVLATNDSRVDEDHPIFGIISATNIDTGYSFNLSGAQIVNSNTISLDVGANPTHGTTIDHRIQVSFRYRTVSRYVFRNQPVRHVVSVVGSTSGPLPEVNYTLVGAEDPLLNGNSTIASDSLEIHQVGGIPTGLPTSVTDESHVLTGSDRIRLDNIGVRTSSIVVRSVDGTITYISDIESVTPDYFIQPGGLTEPTTIQRNPDGAIANGQEVRVDYIHEENFTVTYTTNQLLSDLQAVVDEMKHTTADALVKETTLNEVDIECTVILKRNADQAATDSAIRTNVSRYINRSRIGQNIYQSDIIDQIENVAGVEYVVVPFAKMVKAEGSSILREPLDNASIQASSGDVGIWIISERLEFVPQPFGGPFDRHKGVFQDELPLELVTNFSDLTLAPGRAMIIGPDGMSVPGYTDLPGNVGKEAELTGRRVILSLPSTDTPLNHSYRVSYIVGEEEGAKDITVASMESLALGRFTITYTRAR